VDRENRALTKIAEGSYGVSDVSGKPFEEDSPMKIIAFEEHYELPAIHEAGSATALRRQG
jgi:hypothetical protein